MHSGTQTPSRQPRFVGQRSGTTPLQLKSFWALHASGARGNVAGSLSSQSHGEPAHGQSQATKPSLSLSVHDAPPSQLSCAAATLGTAIARAKTAPTLATKHQSRNIEIIVVPRRRADKQLCASPNGLLGFVAVLRWPRSLMWLPVVVGVGHVSCGKPRPAATTAHTPFTVWLLDERLTSDGEDKPIPNARVVLDPAGGGDRVTMTTEPDGHVTFDDDFTQGGASITVLSDDHVYVTMLEASPDSARARPNVVGKPPSDLVIFPPRLDKVTERLTVELRGNIFGFTDPTNEVALSASALTRLGAATVLDPLYTLRAARGRPFFVIGHALKDLIDRDGNVVSNEIVKSFRIDLPARNDDELLDIDLATIAPLQTRLLSFRAELPQVADSPFVAGTRAYASVLSADSGVTLGIFASASKTADGRAFDIGVTVAQTDIAPERAFTQAVLAAPDGSRSVRIDEGIAAAGTTWSDFMVPPTIPDSDTPRSVRDPIPLTGFPPGAELTVRVLAGSQLLWVLYGPPGGPHKKSFTIPYRDEVTVASVQLFAVTLVAQTDRVVLPGHGELYRRSSSSHDVLVGKR